MDLEHYLRTVLARVADRPVKQIAELPPWNFVDARTKDENKAA
jgi:hypothetical protein